MTVRKFLEKCGLGVYSAQFEESGYDDLDFILDLARNEEKGTITQLAEHLGFKPGHALRFIHAMDKRVAADRGQKNAGDVD